MAYISGIQTWRWAHGWKLLHLCRLVVLKVTVWAEPVPANVTSSKEMRTFVFPGCGPSRCWTHDDSAVSHRPVTWARARVFSACEAGRWKLAKIATDCLFTDVFSSFNFWKTIPCFLVLLKSVAVPSKRWEKIWNIQIKRKDLEFDGFSFHF